MPELSEMKREELETLTGVVSAAISQAISGGEKVVIINHLEVHVNYASGCYATIAVSKSEGDGSAKSSVSHSTFVSGGRR